MKYSPRTILFGLICLLSISSSSFTQSSPPSFDEGEIWPKKPIQFAKKGGSGGSDCAILSIENNQILIEGIVYTSLNNFLIGTFYDMSLHAAIAIKIYPNHNKELLLTEINKEIYYGIDGIPLLPEVGDFNCTFCPSYPKYHIGYIDDKIDISDYPILGDQECDLIEQYFIEAKLTLMYALEDYPYELHPIHPEDYSSCNSSSIWPESCYQHLNNFDHQSGCFDCEENELHVQGKQRRNTMVSTDAALKLNDCKYSDNKYYIFDFFGNLICKGKNYSKSKLHSQLPQDFKVYYLIEQDIQGTKVSKLIR